METNKSTIIVTRYDSPCGGLLLGSIGDALCLCDWTSDRHRDRNDRRIRRLLNAEYSEGTSEALRRTAKELDEYFAGDRLSFDIPLRPAGSAFQKSVWDALLTIPYGETRSYAEIAKAVCTPKGVRAVAQAIGSNAISVIIPCHRVIGSDRSLTGFAGGLDAKRIILELEAKSAEDQR